MARGPEWVVGRLQVKMLYCSLMLTPCRCKKTQVSKILNEIPQILFLRPISPIWLSFNPSGP